jgi:hypothetical protein
VSSYRCRVGHASAINSLVDRHAFGAEGEDLALAG